MSREPSITYPARVETVCKNGETFSRVQLRQKEGCVGLGGLHHRVRFICDIRSIWDIDTGCRYPPEINVWDIDMGYGCLSEIYTWNIHLG